MCTMWRWKGIFGNVHLHHSHPMEPMLSTYASRWLEAWDLQDWALRSSAGDMAGILHPGKFTSLSVQDILFV